MKLGVFLDGRLREDGGALWIETGGNPVADHIDGILPYSAGVGIIARQSVQVGNEEKAFVVAGVLQSNPVLQRDLIIAEMKITGRPHAADDPFLFIDAQIPLPHLEQGYYKP